MPARSDYDAVVKHQIKDFEESDQLSVCLTPVWKLKCKLDTCYSFYG